MNPKQVLLNQSNSFFYRDGFSKRFCFILRSILYLLRQCFRCILHKRLLRLPLRCLRLWCRNSNMLFWKLRVIKQICNLFVQCIELNILSIFLLLNRSLHFLYNRFWLNLFFLRSYIKFASDLVQITGVQTIKKI